MSVLVLIALSAICWRLWQQLGELRERVLQLEDAARPAEYADREYLPEPLPAPPPPAAFVPTPTIPPACIVAPAPEPVAPPPAREPTFAEPVAAPGRGFAFEDIFGRKLPIWGGGVTLAVAGFLIVKYSIDSGLLSPSVRVVLGLLFGTALIAGAEVALRRHTVVRDPRIRQALSGAGIATLYASILVAANLYHLVGPLAAFVGMAAVTALAAALSIRFGAPSAVLGLVGGLAAPALVGSGSPDVPLLSAYLALAVGGLCALSRSQRWMWLGVAALVGGFGWGMLLILGGALGLAAALSVGGLVLLLGVGLPVLLFAGEGGRIVRLAGSLAACAQLAVLVATGGFAPLHWGLFALVSIAIVWLSRREAALGDIAGAGLAVALLLAAGWPAPTPGTLAAVLSGIALIHGVPSAWRVWRSDGRLSDAGLVAAIAAAVLAVPLVHFPAMDDRAAAALAALGALLAGAVAALGWTNPTRAADSRFVVLSATAAALAVIAGGYLLPEWAWAPWMAIAAAGLLLLAHRAADERVEWAAWAFGGGVLALLLVQGADARDIDRAIGVGGRASSPLHAIRWLVPAAVAALFSACGRTPHPRAIAEPVAVLLGYVAAAQVVPTTCLPLVPAAILAALALARRELPAMAMAGAVAIGWAAWPLGTWLAGAGGALLGEPLFVAALPSIADTLLRLSVPALALGAVLTRPLPRAVRDGVAAAGGLLAGAALHVAYKHVFAIANVGDFVHAGMAERTLWEALLALGAFLTRHRAPLAARALMAASLLHFAWFTALLHDPLWADQAVGAWPVVNLLLPAYATALALLWAAGRLRPALPDRAQRVRGWAQMALVLLFAASSLRQLIHGSLPSHGVVGQGEDIARSILAIALAVGFLQWGITRRAQDWRIASLVLMLGAVAKVFLLDASGLDGLLRIASFAALGFSLIGIGWLYSRTLPDAAVNPSQATL